MSEQAERSKRRGTPARYDPAVLEAHPAFAVGPADPELVARVEEAGWPDGLLDRVLALRRDRSEIDHWLATGFPTPEMLEQWAETQAGVLNSTLACRQASWEDDPLLVDLCANAPETVGEWTVTVERGPNPYAQFRLQEHPNVMILEDRRVALGMTASSVRNAYVGGRRTTVHFMSGWRVRDGFRGMGLSRLLQSAAGPGVSWFGLVTYYFVRDGNASAGWIDQIVSEMSDRPEGFGATTDQLSASVWYLPGRPGLERSPRVRPATVDDLDRCRELINRTHEGLDLFRPYSEDYLDERMSGLGWGQKPWFYPWVYGLADYRVLEVDGEVVACGGLWDRGRDVREVWRHPSDEHADVVVDPAAVLDFGYEAGAEASMAELLRHLLAESDELDRSGLLAPLEFLPEVAELLADLEPRVESRLLHVVPFTSPELAVEADVTRPYVDLAYW